MAHRFNFAGRDAAMLTKMGINGEWAKYVAVHYVMTATVVDGTGKIKGFRLYDCRYNTTANYSYASVVEQLAKGTVPIANLRLISTETGDVISHLDAVPSDEKSYKLICTQGVFEDYPRVDDAGNLCADSENIRTYIATACSTMFFVDYKGVLAAYPLYGNRNQLNAAASSAHEYRISLDAPPKNKITHMDSRESEGTVIDRSALAVPPFKVSNLCWAPCFTNADIPSCVTSGTVSALMSYVMSVAAKRGGRDIYPILNIKNPVSNLDNYFGVRRDVTSSQFTPTLMQPYFDITLPAIGMHFWDMPSLLTEVMQTLTYSGVSPLYDRRAAYILIGKLLGGRSNFYVKTAVQSGTTKKVWTTVAVAIAGAHNSFIDLERANKVGTYFINMPLFKNVPSMSESSMEYEIPDEYKAILPDDMWFRNNTSESEDEELVKLIRDKWANSIVDDATINKVEKLEDDAYSINNGKRRDVMRNIYSGRDNAAKYSRYIPAGIYRGASTLPNVNQALISSVTTTNYYNMYNSYNGIKLPSLSTLHAFYDGMKQLGYCVRHTSWSEDSVYNPYDFYISIPNIDVILGGASSKAKDFYSMRLSTADTATMLNPITPDKTPTKAQLAMQASVNAVRDTYTKVDTAGVKYRYCDDSAALLIQDIQHNEVVPSSYALKQGLAQEHAAGYTLDTWMDAMYPWLLDVNTFPLEAIKEIAPLRMDVQFFHDSRLAMSTWNACYIPLLPAAVLQVLLQGRDNFTTLQAAIDMFVQEDGTTKTDNILQHVTSSTYDLNCLVTTKTVINANLPKLSMYPQMDLLHLCIPLTTKTPNRMVVELDCSYPATTMSFDIPFAIEAKECNLEEINVILYSKQDILYLPDLHNISSGYYPYARYYNYSNTDTITEILSNVKMNIIIKGNARHIVGVPLPVDPAERLCGSANITNIFVLAPVETITPYAFANLEHLQRVKLPGTLRDIPVGLCMNCPSLELVNMGNGIRTIQQRAFFAAAGLRILKLPPSVQIVAAEAFKACSSIQDFSADGLQLIAASAFADTNAYVLSQVSRLPQMESKKKIPTSMLMKKLDAPAAAQAATKKRSTKTTKADEKTAPEKRKRRAAKKTEA